MHVLVAGAVYGKLTYTEASEHQLFSTPDLGHGDEYDCKHAQSYSSSVLGTSRHAHATPRPDHHHTQQHRQQRNRSPSPSPSPALMPSSSLTTTGTSLSVLGSFTLVATGTISSRNLPAAWAAAAFL